MGKRQWLVATCAAITLATASCTTSSNKGNPGGDFTRISFIETSQEPGDTPIERIVKIHIAHDKGRLKRMRFSSHIAGVLIDERLWDAAQPGAIKIRTWLDCEQAEGEMPTPLPESLEMVLEEYFGPRTVPAAHTTSTDGSATWEVRMDELTKRFTDNGSQYPASRTIQFGADGEVGSTITRGSIEKTADMPAWAQGWDSCEAVARME